MRSESFFSAKPHWLVHLDPRLKILLAGLVGVLTWHVSVLGLGVYGTMLWILVADAGLLTRKHWPMLRSYGSFVLLWGLLTFALECFVPEPDYAQAAAKGGVFAFRLAVLIGIGLTLALFSSPRQLGLALSWFLRPVLGKHSWKTALSLALMIHFIPMAQQTFAQVKQAMALRQPPRNRWQRFLLVPQAVLRILAQKTWTQTVAIAARGLDGPDAWRAEFPPQPAAWIAGLLAGVAAISVLFV